MTSSARWGLLWTAPRSEILARDDLEARGFEVYLPMSRRTVRSRHRKASEPVEVLRPAFPRYLFVGADRFDWTLSRRALGIVAIIAIEGAPVFVSRHSIEDVMALQDMGYFDEVAPGAGSPVSLHVGEAIVLTSGLLEGAMGAVTALPRRRDGRVTIDLMGRAVKVPLDQVRRLA